MKKVSVQCVLIVMLSGLFFSCNNSEKRNRQATEQDTASVEETTTSEDKVENSTTFDINNIPVSTEDIGNFPFFNLPEGLRPLNRPIERKYDMLFFPIDGIMTPLEGRVWKSYISVEDRHEDDWSLLYFQKSYDEAITTAGGVKIFDGKISYEEYERYHDEATYLGEDGSIGYTDENIKVYVIRQQNGDDVYIQLTGNTAGGKLNILQKAAFKQSIRTIKSEEILKELNEKGKVVLYINFDTDKATLKPNGMETVGEIIKVLENDPKLKIAINGYTDDSGSKERNQILSEDRASAVKAQIMKAGISVDRLTAKGYGQDNPIADNSSDEGKAQNRRVELVKI